MSWVIRAAEAPPQLTAQTYVYHAKSRAGTLTREELQDWERIISPENVIRSWHEYQRLFREGGPALDEYNRKTEDLYKEGEAIMEEAKRQWELMNEIVRTAPKRYGTKGA